MNVREYSPNNSQWWQKPLLGLNNSTLLSFMATYPVVNTKTGEQKEVKMSIHDWDQWCTDNPDWLRDYSDPSTMPGVGEVGEWQNKLVARNPGWNEVLDRASRAPGSKVKKIT
tara:strand:- start:152 stop:490 length:339 start_codon:yes stop_codon:yes gene_type:complete